MQYRRVPKNGDELSVLGFGTMRLPTIGDKIDEERAKKELRYAIDNGVNYVDTAYPYHDGESENFVGRALKDGYREKVKLATKLPVWLLKSSADMDEFLNIQLEKLRTDHIDYYLLHSLNANTWESSKSFGALEFLDRAKKDGRIVNAGFSFHGDRKTFMEIVDSYDWEFCLIQYNFIDEETQAGTEGLKYAASKDLAVMVMEPLRGGFLTGELPEEVSEIYSEAKEKRTPAERALRWILDHPEVTVVLSGMNDEEHIKENIGTCTSALPGSMSEEEAEIMRRTKEVYKRLIMVPCTGCSYCMPCPNGVNIPQCFYFYNHYYMMKDKSETKMMYSFQLLGMMGDPADASLCINCGECLDLCPQQIDIPDEMEKVAEIFK